MRRSVLLRTGILLASMAFAALAFFLADSRRDNKATDLSSKHEVTDYTSPRAVLPEERLGAAAYFPQGTNPPIGSQLKGVTSGVGNITIDAARREGDSVTAFGTFLEGKPECRLARSPDGDLIPASAELQMAGDAFLFTARPDASEASGSMFVRCTLAGRPADVAEREVEAG